MARRILGNMVDRKFRIDANFMFEELYGDVNNLAGKITDEVYDEIRNNVNLVWQTPVDTQAGLPTDATSGDTRMTRDTGTVYRYNGTDWIEIQQLNPDAITEVDNRLQTEIDAKETPEGAQEKADIAESSANDYTDNLVTAEGSDVVRIVEQGENSNGRYIRYSDGKQEVYLKPVTLASNNEYGNMHRSDPHEITYPAPFESSYHVYATADVTSVGHWANCYAYSDGTKVQIQSYSFWSNAAYSVYTYAVGRWK